MGKREMDDEQRERMREVKRFTVRGLLWNSAFLAAAIALGVHVYDDWTAYLFWGLVNLVMTVVVFVSHWRYIRRGPFPRLPANLRDEARR
ncbi:hypothetical protein [Lentzea sp. CC55]|uniref:hypothetical protein n=1 Tax=Lentzea sp. CC55 TaxID=2884909 RepID=UPI001F424822|nr:hypothetical protein [Lentzea sp. CC55]MCG8924918.1 hypothetical protein [Lentzea sp. CC55]